MALFKCNHVELTGLACALPKNSVRNKDYPYHTPKENQQFIQTTGIVKRHIVESGITASDLCLQAANSLLEEKKVDKSEINLVIFLSQTPDYKIPCTATILQHKLELPNTCLAFDINLGCSGYVYGLSIAASLLSNLKGKALLLVGDTSSTCVNQMDKSAAPLFSDAGSATLLNYAVDAVAMSFNLQSDGKGYDAIISKDGGARNPISNTSLVQDESTNRRPIDMLLDGIKVFNFSRKEVVPNINYLIDQEKINKEDVDAFVFHQANLFMNESIRKKLELEEEKVPYSLKDYGNTSSASIPVTIAHALQNKLTNANTKLILSGFGVGLSWGSAYLELKNPTILPIIEV